MLAHNKSQIAEIFWNSDKIHQLKFRGLNHIPARPLLFLPKTHMQFLRGGCAVLAPKKEAQRKRPGTECVVAETLSLEAMIPMNQSSAGS